MDAREGKTYVAHALDLEAERPRCLDICVGDVGVRCPLREKMHMSEALRLGAKAEHGPSFPEDGRSTASWASTLKS